MSRECRKCGGQVPKFVWIQGKKRNCQRRKYCLTCSPFGLHNTRILEKHREKHSKLKKCPVCLELHSQKGNKCFKCYFYEREKLIQEKVSNLLGGFTCWMCGYNKTKKNICFHHVNESEKLFGLTTRELVGYSWEKVTKEIDKCILVCHNCHGEIHEGIISSQKVQLVWESRPSAVD